MIPKKIHYCWFGGKPLPPLAEKCIASWKKYCPDYEIIRWDESNYDFSKHPFMKQAYQEKKWAFVTDYARLDIIYNNGGLYFDTDVELLRSPDTLLSNSLFVGFENEQFVNTGQVFGGEAGHIILKKLRDDYDNILFSSSNLIPCPQIQTRTLKSLGLQDDTGEIQFLPADTAIYPTEYFCPKHGWFNRYKLTSNTYSIHHCAASWLSRTGKLKSKLNKLIGYDNYSKLKRLLRK